MNNITGVRVWKISIIERSYDISGSYVDKTIRHYTLGDVNYFKIPNQFLVESFQSEFLFTIDGLDINGNTVIHDEPRPSIGDGTPLMANKTWLCNGYDFAYNIVQYTDEGHTHANYALEDPGWVYEYIRPNDLPCSPADQGFYDFVSKHGLLPEYCGHLGEPNWLDAVLLENNTENGTIYFDHDGVPITTPTVAAIQKRAYYWDNCSIFANNFTGVNTFMQYELSDIVNFMNDYSNIDEQIADGCTDEELFCSFGGGTFDSFLSGSSDNNSLIDCYLDNLNWNENPLDDSDYNGDDQIDIWDDYWWFANCDEGSEPIDLNGLQISELTERGWENTLIFNHADIYDTDGQWQLPNFVLNPGLYSILFDLPNKPFIQYYREVETPMTNSMNLANLIDASVFPVPIVENEFSLLLNASSKLKFEYRILNSTGDQIHSETMSLNQGFSGSVKIHTENPLNKGLNIHQFIFPDGSIKSLTSITY